MAVSDLDSLFESLTIDEHRGDANLEVSALVKTAAVDKTLKNKKKLQDQIYNELVKTGSNSFDHRLFFRASHLDLDAPPRSQRGDLQSRLPLPKGGISRYEAQYFLTEHLNKKSRVNGPYISLTNDLLRVFNVAYNYQREGNRGVTIFVIDSWRLHDGSFSTCNELCKKVGVDTNTLYKTEIIVEDEVPREAIMYEWTWEDLKNSGLFDIFPALAYRNGEYGFVERLRDTINPMIDDFPVAELVDVLIDQLGLACSKMSTKQIALIMLGWARGMCKVDHYPYLQQTLEEEASMEVRALDEKLYEKDLARRRYARTIVLKVRDKFFGASHPAADPGPERLVAWGHRVYGHLDFQTWWSLREKAGEDAPETTLLGE